MFVSFTPFDAPLPDAEDWTTTELGAVELHDQRLTQRTCTLVKQAMAKPTLSLPAACDTAAEVKAAYRLFDHARVTPAALLAPHATQTRHRMTQEPLILLTDDLTYLDYTGKTVAQELGLLGNRKTRGLVASPLLALTPDRVCLGVAAWDTWTRDPTQPPADTRCAQQPLAEKETRHWLERYQQVCAWQTERPATTLVYLADRGGDLLELYQEAQRQQDAGRCPARFVIRACYDRGIVPETVPPPETEDAPPPVPRRLWARLAVTAPSGTLTLTLPATPTRTARTATCTLTAVTVTLRPAKKGRGETIVVHAVRLQEVSAVPPGETPIQWTLLTNLPIDTAAELATVVHYYGARWQVELFFKVLKSGCQVEQLYLQTRRRLVNALALYVLVAWRVLYLSQIGRAAPALPCTVVFTRAEWEAAYRMAYRRVPPATPGTLQEMLQLIGAFGGFYPRKGVPDPGITSLWIGTQRLQDFTAAYETFGPATQRRRPSRRD